MEENKFEKQVQQKMSELKIAPSDAVWNHVKLNIEKRKDRRWILLISIFGFIALLSGLYYFSAKNYSSSKNELRENNTVIDSAQSSSANKTSPIAQENNLPGKALEKNIPANSKNIPANQPANIFKKETYDNKKIVTLTKHDKGNLLATITSQQDELPIINTNNNTDSTGISSVVISGRVNMNVNLDSFKNNTATNVINNDTSINVMIAQTEKQVDSSTLISKNKKSVTVISRKWHIGFFLSGGISHAGNQFLGLGKSAADYLSGSVNSGNPQGTGNLPISNPSGVKNSVGYIAGIFFEKNIFAKTKFSLGLNYKVFSTSNLVGIKNNTSRTYSLANADNQYYNHFRFIEVPLGLKVQIGNSKTFPLFWSGGATLTQLISNNALQFNPNASATDPAAMAYYSDNSFFNKTFIGFSTGLSSSVYTNRNLSVLFGPNFYYSATKLANAGLYNKKHFVFFGLHTEIIFDKK